MSVVSGLIWFAFWGLWSRFDFMKRDEIWEAAGFQRNPSNFKQNFRLYRFKIHFACFSITGDCKDGIHCKSTFSPHFKRYSHTLLATTRSCGIFENTNKEKTNESVSQFYLLSILNNFFSLWLLSFLCL